jgi:hypothetical protein
VLPGLLDGVPSADGTLLSQGERFGAIIARIMSPSLFERTERGSIAMNEVAKESAEN